VIAGLALTLLAIVVSTVMDGNSFGPLIGPSSFLLVLGCAFGAAMISVEVGDLKQLPKALARALKAVDVDYDARVEMFMELADTARREGLLTLDAKLGDIEDPFVRHALQLVTDGVDEQQLRAEVATWARSLDERHAQAPALLRKLAVYSPAFGMVGTVIGLVNMLGNLSSPDQLGGGMALALLTTLYGSLFANLVFQPLAERLEKLHEAEMSLLAFDADAVAAIQTGTSARSLVGHLESLLPPASRVGFEARTAVAA
jgi:chemotaxis protein MotA